VPPTLLLFIESFRSLLSGSIVLSLITNDNGGAVSVGAQSGGAFAGDFGGYHQRLRQTLPCGGALSLGSRIPRQLLGAHRLRALVSDF
jgi:hypothetical protein